MDRPTTIRVWEPLTRLFHWSLVLAFVAAWATGDDWLRPHEIAGYVAGGLVLFRIGWGFVGPRYVRFSEFVHPPRVVFSYLGDVAHFRATRHLGHNPAGGGMIIAMLISLLLTVVTGALALEYPVGELFEEAHEFLANLSLFLVFGHVAGVLLASFQHRENLVRAMITGRKPASTPR